jgi:hypothetical protein
MRAPAASTDLRPSAGRHHHVLLPEDDPGSVPAAA